MAKRYQTTATSGFLYGGENSTKLNDPERPESDPDSWRLVGVVRDGVDDAPDNVGVVWYWQRQIR